MDESNDDEDRGKSPWVKAGIFGALGAEFVGLTIGGFLVGNTADQKLGTEPWGTLAGILLALVVAGWHIILITKRFISEDDPE